MKTIVTRDNRDRSFVALLEDSTLHVSPRSGWTDASSANQPCAEVRPDGTITDYSAAKRQIGYLDEAGQVFSGHAFGNHELLGRVDGAQLLLPSGNVIARADGPNPGKALAAALLSGCLDPDGQAQTRPTSSLLGILGAVQSVAEPLTGTDTTPGAEAPGTPEPYRAPALPPQTRHNQEIPPPSPSRHTAGVAAFSYLPRHTKRSWGRSFNPGNRVHVRKPLTDYGPGVILAVSSELEYGAGTKLYPRFLVQLDSGARQWCSGTDLTKL